MSTSIYAPNGTIGPVSWHLQRDDNSHRTYKVVYRVISSDMKDGPANAIQTPGLPVYGDVWQPPGTNDVDVWAFCRWPCTVTPKVEGQPNKFFDLEFTFSTKPDKAYCLDNQQEDPLLIPPRISGKSVKYTEEASYDRFGNPIVNSAWEQIRGPQVEFDADGKDSVHIEMNVPILNLPFLYAFKNKVNSQPIWGFAPRCVKLSMIDWDRQFYGTCFPFYTWKLDFETNVNTFDRSVLDEGTKVLHGHWDFKTGNWVLDNINSLPPSPFNPNHFDRYKDRNGENARVILDGQGLPAGVLIGTGTSSTTYNCITCTSPQPLTISLTPSDPLGHTFFDGPYAAYQPALAFVLQFQATSPCFYTFTSGVVQCTLDFSADPVAQEVYVTITFSTIDDSVPTVLYQFILTNVLTNNMNCNAVGTCLLVVGDPANCPEKMIYTPAGSAPTGPEYSGGPGTRFIQRYQEIDLGLLGLPLFF